MRVRNIPGAKEFLRTVAFHYEVDSPKIKALVDQYSGRVALEIGVGKGDYLLMMAKKFPNILFVGVELNASVFYIASKKFLEANLNNLIISNGDALHLLLNLTPESVDYVILNHSDPWPKKRHEKRRLTHPRFLKEYYRVLKKGGHLLFKTDNDVFAEYSKEMLGMLPFTTLNYVEDYKGDDVFDAKTEYENKFTLKGVKIKRIVGRK